MTAAPFAQHLAVIKLDATSGTAVTDYSSDVIKATATPTDTNAEFYTVDTPWAKQLRGGKMLEIKIDCVAGSTLHQRVLDAWEDSETYATGQFFWPDETSGSLQFDGEFMIVNDGDSAAAEGGKADVNTASFTLRSHGTVTQSVVS